MKIKNYISDVQKEKYMCSVEVLDLWKKIRHKTNLLAQKEPFLYNFYHQSILQHDNISSALSYILSNKLSTSLISASQLQNIFEDVYLRYPSIINDVVKDMKYILKKDPVVKHYLTPLLYLKGFHAIEAYRISHILWKEKKNELSLFLQHRISSIFSVDIHPAAKIGSSIILDHATGVVIGENVIIENKVLIFQSVTLGSTGKNISKIRHPKIRKGVIIGAGAKILGNIEVGIGAKIGAGSVVLQNVPPYVTVAGVPARIVGKIDSKNFFFRENKRYFCNINTFQYGDGI